VDLFNPNRLTRLPRNWSSGNSHYSNVASSALMGKSNPSVPTQDPTHPLPNLPLAARASKRKEDIHEQTGTP
jgi:hypothetical protein